MRNSMNTLMGVIMVHLEKDNKHAYVSVNKGIKMHDEKAVEALLSEFGQIHKYDTFDPQRIGDFPKDVKAKALNLIAMIKEKKDGRIKARACADMRK